MTDRRLNIALPDTTMTCLNNIQGRLQSTNRTEVVRRALLLMDKLLKHEEAGGEISLVNGDDRKTLTIG